MPVEEKAKILLVDDRPENLLALESVLQDPGQCLVKAHSGKEALKHVLNEEFAVILLDVQMPDIDGFETASLIRAREKSQHTPILFLTAINKGGDHVAHGYSVGAVDYVLKPFDPEILRAKVSAFVELYKKTRELQEEVARRTKAEAEVRKLNRELERRVQARTAELKAANQELELEVAERKRAEANIQALNERLQRAMTETHHRVKNNLQIIAAMLDTHLIEATPMVSVSELKRLSNYVRTLAMVHDILTQHAKADGQANYLSTREVLEELLPMLQQSVVGRAIHFEVEDVTLPSRQVTSLALVTNELVSNALKHSSGPVEITLSLEADQVCMEVCDHGPGFPSDFDPERAANTGLELINNLSRWDLSGTVSFTNRPEGGGRVCLQFPRQAHPEPSFLHPEEVRPA